VEVTIKLGGQLLLGNPRNQKLTLEHPMTVLDLAFLLGLEPDEVGLIVINGIQSELEDQISADCTVSFFPYLSGG
jgi:molybdopterin converting factor small subunit